MGRPLVDVSGFFVVTSLPSLSFFSLAIESSKLLHYLILWSEGKEDIVLIVRMKEILICKLITGCNGKWYILSSIEFLCGVGKFYPLLVEDPENLLVYLLLDIHVDGIIWRWYIVDGLEVERVGAECLKMGSVARNTFDGAHRFDHRTDDRWYLLHMLLLGFIGDSQREHDSSPFHLLVIMDSRSSEIGVRYDEHFTAEHTNATRLYADSLDDSGFIAEHDEVSNLKRLIEEYDKVAEQVAQYALSRYGDCDTSNTKTGESGGDIEPEIRKEEEQSDNPEDELHQRYEWFQVFLMIVIAPLLLEILGKAQLDPFVH